MDYFGARMYDSDVARFLSLDEKAVKYPNLSPYNYVAGNPIFLIDPDGKEIKPYHITGTDAAGLAVYKAGEVSANTATVLRQMIMTPEGLQFLSQFAKAGDQIAGVTFKADGKLSEHTLNVYDYSLENFEGNLPSDTEGSFSHSFNESTGNVTFNLSLMTRGMDEGEIAAVYTHETQLHGKSDVETFTKAAIAGGKAGYDKAKAAEQKVNPSGEQDHADLKNKNPKSAAYKNYSKQKEQILKNKPGYEKAFKKTEKQ